MGCSPLLHLASSLNSNPTPAPHRRISARLPVFIPPTPISTAAQVPHLIAPHTTQHPSPCGTCLPHLSPSNPHINHSQSLPTLFPPTEPAQLPVQPLITAPVHTPNKQMQCRCARLALHMPVTSDASPALILPGAQACVTNDLTSSIGWASAAWQSRG